MSNDETRLTLVPTPDAETIDYDGYVEAFESYAKKQPLDAYPYDALDGMLYPMSKGWTFKSKADPANPYTSLIDTIKQGLGCIPGMCKVVIRLVDSDPLYNRVTIRHTMRAHRRSYSLDPINPEPEYTVIVPERHQEIKIYLDLLTDAHKHEILTEIIKKLRYECGKELQHHG